MVKYLFRDTWNAFRTMGIKFFSTNFLFLVCLGTAFLLPFALKFHPITFILGFLAGLYLLHLCIGTLSRFFSRHLDGEEVPVKSLFTRAGDVRRGALVLTLVSLIQLTLLYFGFPFYLSLEGFAGIIAVSLVFWASVCWQLASQYYFAVLVRLKFKPGKTLQKCFIFLLDNFFFTIFLGILTVIILALSAVTAFIFPGIGGVALLHQTAFKQRLRKYDYLEAHPHLTNKKAIPWDKLLDS